ncbi:hypothetical protein JW711_01085 [Candidatus Woesearchaeota archaeon]|nr:hypothetical protein [Candidatus Woesearchaeota archaeon]
MVSFARLQQLVTGTAPLSAKDVLAEAYAQLGARNPCVEYALVEADGRMNPDERWESMAHRIIAEDNDYHRSRTGYMSYDRVRIMPWGCVDWVIALGEKTGSYPGSQYLSDMIAVPAGELLLETEYHCLESIPEEQRCSFFRSALQWIYGPQETCGADLPFSNSLIIVQNDGTFKFPKSGYGARMGQDIGKPLAEYHTPQGYERKTIPLLVTGIEDILSSVQ